ncbi:MAG: peptidoglycan-binding protein [Alphaproteobacteria bacterium]|nr:peptidoglycan-binding protein [Alphaproteobacteria bacterium]
MNTMVLFRFIAAAIGFLLGCAAAAANGQGYTREAPVLARPVAALAQITITPVDAMNAEMRRAYIIGIQEELAAHGYQPGPADGVMGSQTVAAIRAYQSDAGLPVTGVASKELLDHMKFVLPKVYAGDTPPGQASAVYLGLVEEVQIELQKRGYYVGIVDGDEGPRTREAITRFQRDAGLPASGRADALVLRQLLVTDPGIRSPDQSN